ncbi:MAG: GNAT family N-acetyltransferase [Clostridia bacterium]|nr:GNAT family N-acetyltransferase [Clostridia bacterium]
MYIRRAEIKDIPKIIDLLLQVHLVHSTGRPDIFRRGSKKYTEDELSEIIADDGRPIFVADDAGEVVGYAFCVLEEIKDDGSLEDRKSLYIDDICVDEKRRGTHIGEALYNYVTAVAKELGCYHVTLNVWCLNPGAMKFYEKMGMTPLKVTMEKIL